jgi:hypothetical protein
LAAVLDAQALLGDYVFRPAERACLGVVHGLLEWCWWGVPLTPLPPSAPP